MFDHDIFSGLFDGKPYCQYSKHSEALSQQLAGSRSTPLLLEPPSSSFINNPTSSYEESICVEKKLANPTDPASSFFFATGRECPE